MILPIVRLNKILVFFALNLRLFSFFHLIVFALIALMDSISAALTLKRKVLCRFTCTKNTSEIKEIWLLSLQPPELYYILLVFLC